MQHYGKLDQYYDGRLKSLREYAQRIETIMQQSGYDAGQLLQNVASLQDDTLKLKQKVSSNLMEEFDEKHKLLLEAQGRLNALEKMIQEGITAKVITVMQSSSVTNEIALLKKQIAESTLNQQDIQQYLAQIEPLRRRVFRLIGEGQQQGITGIITDTLEELGFTSGSETKAPPMTEKVGASIRVEARQNEKTVVFYVDRDGGISYDFSGYQGSTCVEEAQKIFTALRKKGIAIADAAAEQELNMYALDTISPDLLLDDKFAPQFEVNKLQTKISTLLVHVLQEKMNFSHIIQNTSGGSIIIDAVSEIGIGYHVILSRQGETTVIKNGEDMTDPGSDLW